MVLRSNHTTHNGSKLVFSLIYHKHEWLTTSVAWDMSHDHPAPLTAPCAPLKQSDILTASPPLPQLLPLLTPPPSPP